MYSGNLKTFSVIKGIVHPKMQIYSHSCQIYSPHLLTLTLFQTFCEVSFFC